MLPSPPKPFALCPHVAAVQSFFESILRLLVRAAAADLGLPDRADRKCDEQSFWPSPCCLLDSSAPRPKSAASFASNFSEAHMSNAVTPSGKPHDIQRRHASAARDHSASLLPTNAPPLHESPVMGQSRHDVFPGDLFMSVAADSTSTDAGIRGILGSSSFPLACSAKQQRRQAASGTRSRRRDCPITKRQQERKPRGCGGTATAD